VRRDVRPRKMKREFKVILEKDGEDFVMTCPDFADVVVRAPTREQAMKKMKKILTEKSKESGETEGK
jgi:predicted RNase H-like HicB family nuclease